MTEILRYAVHSCNIIEIVNLRIIYFVTTCLPNVQCGCNLSIKANLIILLVNTLQTAK